MAPKAGKKKKSKEEIEAERLAAEEAARLAEEGAVEPKTHLSLCTYLGGVPHHPE